MFVQDFCSGFIIHLTLLCYVYFILNLFVNFLVNFLHLLNLFHTHVIVSPQVAYENEKFCIQRSTMCVHNFSYVKRNLIQLENETLLFFLKQVLSHICTQPYLTNARYCCYSEYPKNCFCIKCIKNCCYGVCLINFVWFFFL